MRDDNNDNNVIQLNLEGARPRPVFTAFKFLASDPWKEALDDITDHVGAVSCAETLRKIVPVYRELLGMTSDDGVLTVVTDSGQVTKSLL
jgi:hypothetical protein